MSFAFCSNAAYALVAAENSKQASTESTTKDSGNGNIAAQAFTFRELASVTKNFRPECLVGEGGFGRVYKGRLENTGQVRLPLCGVIDSVYNVSIFPWSNQRMMDGFYHVWAACGSEATGQEWTARQ